MERRPTEPSDPGFRPFSYSSWMRFRMRSCDVKVRVGGVESVVGMGSRQISVADRGPRHRKREQTRASATVDGHAWRCAYRRGHPEGVGRVLGLAFLIFSHRRPRRDEDSSARLYSADIARWPVSIARRDSLWTRGRRKTLKTAEAMHARTRSIDDGDEDGKAKALGLPGVALTVANKILVAVKALWVRSSPWLMLVRHHSSDKSQKCP